MRKVGALVGALASGTTVIPINPKIGANTM